MAKHQFKGAKVLVEESLVERAKLDYAITVIARGQLRSFLENQIAVFAKVIHDQR